jgi:hypothetical protein
MFSLTYSSLHAERHPSMLAIVLSTTNAAVNREARCRQPA